MEEKQWGLTPEQKQVSGLFYNNSANGIIIYTEDSDNEHGFYVGFYTRLLEHTGVVIDKVIHLGNCDNVQQECRDDKDTTFPKLYVIDGDIYLQYDPKQSQDRLCVLDRYCIENYLIDEATLSNVIKTYKKELKNEEVDVEDIKIKLKYTSILQNFAQCFVPIYHYCSILSEENRKRRPSKSACFSVKGWDHYYNVSSNSCITKNFEEFISETMSELKALPDINESYIDNKLKERQRNFPCDIPTLIKIVSAKKQIFPFLMTLTTRKFGVSPSLSEWKIKSADFYDTTPLKFLKEKIVTIYNEWKKSSNREVRNPTNALTQ